ncbi:MAG TPA: HEPN domain-containing protein [Anaerolineales bacterium]|nr:HEPN domain-containing protein [Anaerolineales bacterium]
MTTPEIKKLIAHAEESHQAAKVLLDGGFFGFSAAQSYYTLFYLTEALLHSKGLQFSSHSAVIAAYGREFSKTAVLDPKYHRRLIVAESRRETGHYGEESSVTDEEARESFEWAGEFLSVTKVYFGI